MDPGGRGPLLFPPALMDYDTATVTLAMPPKSWVQWTDSNIPLTFLGHLTVLLS